MQIIKIDTMEKAEKLKIGDPVLVKWKDFHIRHKSREERITAHTIKEIMHNGDVILTEIKRNYYFNYKVLLGEGGIGFTEEVYLIVDNK